ncbi:DUF1236 domain-containing protein [Paracoccus suum]|uniref:DUF1236 domain-containing protein n=1 Tax=Paracoccus suum TaxID=2259340 RepID=A0A344PI63_9RHOB|nr:DUF1236 domain-containing protein [Paracoccus suum]AXC49068.1 DUF1236 domain-containing protein [Paracoccus suum]
MRTLFATTALAAMALAGAASADTMAKAGTDLNVRSGPGVQHEVVGVIPGGDDVNVKGCIDSANWCEISYKDTTGWAYGDYLAAKVGESFEPIYPNREKLQVSVVEYKAPEVSTGKAVADAGAGAAAGAAAGALVAGPLGAVVGAAVGAGTAQVPAPAPEVKTYIDAHPMDPVILDGEVVVGAGVPENVTLYDIPDQKDYKYVTINGQPVLVGQDRKIVYIYR